MNSYNLLKLSLAEIQRLRVREQLIHGIDVDIPAVLPENDITILLENEIEKIEKLKGDAP